MARRRSSLATLLPLLFVIFIVVGRLDAERTTTSPFEGMFEDIDSCNDDCDKTYPLHTYPEPDDSKACYRGCRLFSLVDFVEVSFNEDFNDTITECRNACGEAYSNPSQLLACELGCSYQLPYAVALHREWADEESNVHLLIPMLSVQSLWQGLIDTYRGMSISYWSVYMQDENGQMYVFESQPEMDVFTLHPDNANKVSAHNWINADTNLQAFRPQTSTDGNGMYDDSSSWLECVSRKSGLPRWLLSMTLFLSVLALIWLCFVTMVTAPEQRVPAPQKLSIYGDLEYLKKGTVSPYPVYIQNMAAKKKTTHPRDDDDDEPLPLKVEIAIQKTLI